MQTNKTLDELHDIGRLQCTDTLDIEDYLKELLCTLWVEADGFSSKRPLGDSDWQDCVYIALIEGGIEGVGTYIDYELSMNREEVDNADKIIIDIIVEVI